MRALVAGFALVTAAAVTTMSAQPSLWPTRLVYHEVVTDEDGIVPWVDPDPAVAYDHVIRQVWTFWRGMRECPNGVPYYLQHQVWKPEQDDPRGLGGDQLAMALSSWNSNTAINAGTMALYVLEHREAWGPSWREDARHILDWADETFHNDEFLRWNVRPINEQTAYRIPGNSHTSRQAATELLYAERSGAWSRKAPNVRRLNWATSWSTPTARTAITSTTCGSLMATAISSATTCARWPSSLDLAPRGQNHLLRSTSVVRTIDYGDDAIRYTKFDAQSTERLKLGAWTPGAVSGGTVRWDAASRVAEIDASSTAVRIARARDRTQD